MSRDNLHDLEEGSKTSRNFLLTLNAASLEFYEDIKGYLLGLANLVYYLCTEHIGQDNKHYHIFVQYSKPAYLSYRRLFGAHVDKCFGSAQKNIAYLRCQDEKHKSLGITYELIDEEGEPMLKGGNYTVGFLEDLDTPNELPAMYYNIYKKIKENKNNRLSIGNWRKEIKVYYIQGPSAIGKSQRAEEIVMQYYQNKGVEDSDQMYFDELKYCNGFYQGVNTDYPSEVAIFDDFRAGVMKPEEFINLIDYRIHNMNIKCGQVKNKYKLIIFTSVQKLSSIYRNVDEFERREQWERRITLINLYPPERVHLGGLPVGYRTDFNQLEEYEVTDDWDGTRTIIN